MSNSTGLFDRCYSDIIFDTDLYLYDCDGVNNANYITLIHIGSWKQPVLLNEGGEVSCLKTQQ